MANKKKPFVAFETKEEFDKWFEEKLERVRLEGRAQGFKDGTVWVLSYIEELLQNLFMPEAFAKAQEEIKHRQIEEWRKNEEVKSLKQKLDMKKLFEEKTK